MQVLEEANEVLAVGRHDENMVEERRGTEIVSLRVEQLSELLTSTAYTRALPVDC